MPAVTRSSSSSTKKAVKSAKPSTVKAASGSSSTTKKSTSLNKWKKGDVIPLDSVKSLQLTRISSSDTGNKTSEIMLSDLFATTERVILFFYPRANTPGCTNQACGFRDEIFPKLPKIKGGKLQIFGCSADSPKSQTTWSKKLGLKYDLLSDLSADRKALKFLGVMKNGSSVLRSWLSLRLDSKKQLVVDNVDYGCSPKQCIQDVLEFLA